MLRSLSPLLEAVMMGLRLRLGVDLGPGPELSGRSRHLSVEGGFQHRDLAFRSAAGYHSASCLKGLALRRWNLADV